MHFDGQLQVSYLIFGCTPSYTSFKDLGPTLLVSNSLLTYIDVQLKRFLLDISKDEGWR